MFGAHGQRMDSLPCSPVGKRVVQGGESTLRG